MIEVDGKQVFTELHELVDPRHSALVVVDMQRDFCTPGGAFAQVGVDISMYPRMVSRLVRLIEAGRDAGLRIIYVLMTVLPGRASESPAQIRFNMRIHHATTDGTPLSYTADGSEGQRLIPELRTTEGCVESTARDAMFNDYYVVIPEDCVASDDRAQHDASLLLMRHRFDVTTSSDILRTWA